jgi:hypothetical protein
MLMLALPFRETYWTKPVQYQAIDATILGPRKLFRQQAIFFYVLKKSTTVSNDAGLGRYK